MKSETTAVSFKNTSYQYIGEYAGEQNFAIREVNLHVGQGSFVVLAGQSGCGKTTISRCINTLVPHFFTGKLTGSVSVLGQDIRDVELYQMGKSVASVFQDPRSQFFTTNSSCEMAFASENYGMPRREMIRKVKRSLSALGIDQLKNKRVFDLSSGERQKIAFAAAHVLSPSIFVLDEPSANLDIKSTLQMREILKQLKREGHTVIIAEHRLFYLSGLIDILFRVEDGCIAESFTDAELAELTPEALRKKGLRQMDLRRITLRPAKRVFGGDTVLEVSGFSYCYKGTRPILRNISFSAKEGEVLAIVGANGCGKTTLGKALAGLIKGGTGHVRIQNHEIPAKKLSNAVYFVMQEADHQLYTDSVRKEFALGKMACAGLNDEITTLLRLLGLEEKQDAHPYALSGGQKQRVAIGAGAISDKPILILDEPTSGLDYNTMKLVADLINRLREKGKLILIITHDLEFLSLTATRAIRLNGGVVSEETVLQNTSDLEKVADWMFADNVQGGAFND